MKTLTLKVNARGSWATVGECTASHDGFCRVMAAVDLLHKAGFISAFRIERNDKGGPTLLAEKNLRRADVATDWRLHSDVYAMAADPACAPSARPL